MFVVDSIERALRRRRQPTTTGARFATTDGAVVWPNGKLTLGTQVSDTEGVLARKRRINELHDEIVALTAAVGEAESESGEAEEALAAAQQDALELSQKIAALTGEHDSMLEEVGRLEQQLTALDAETARRRASHLRHPRAHRQGPAGSRALSTSASRRPRRSSSASRRPRRRRREQRDLRFREESAVSERLGTCQVEIATVSEREVHLKRQVNTITSELKELEHTVAMAQRDRDRARAAAPAHPAGPRPLRRACRSAPSTGRTKLKDRARFEQADSESLRETIQTRAGGRPRGPGRDRREEHRRRPTCASRRASSRCRSTRPCAASSRSSACRSKRRSAAEALDNRTVAEDRAHRLRKQISNLGPVNPIAMEEFESLQSRREFMVSQIEDLDSSRKSLQKVVAAIDRKMRDRFLETFEQVDRSFQEIFGLLFPGGTAQLQLTEPDDPDTTGVEVIAQPRGKKLAKMTLMSGGEKSLTALALLFAVYRTRPCPFYILDEVEAALDDTNLRRFVAFADSMRSQTQFIVVTHQRRTMEMADVLYGVSMQADGVSKVVSQKLDRADVRRRRQKMSTPWYRRLSDGLSRSRESARRPTQRPARPRSRSRRGVLDRPRRHAHRRRHGLHRH